MTLALSACAFDTSNNSGGSGEVGVVPDAGMELPDGIELLDAEPGESNLRLVNDGLVVRYLANEASSGQGPSKLLDVATDNSALSPDFQTDLNIVYYNDGGDGFRMDSGHRGLQFAHKEENARASVELVANHKIRNSLHDTRKATIELVVDVDFTDEQSCLVHFGNGLTKTERDGSRFSLVMDYGHLILFLNQLEVGHWNVELSTLDRVVIQLVMDTTQSIPSERVRFYMNGQRVAPGQHLKSPRLNEGIRLTTVLNEDPLYFVLGNREDGTRGIEATFYYAAIYAEAHTASQVTANYLSLTSDDDSP